MLARKSMLVLFQNLVSGLMGYLGLLFILRYVGLETYGIFSYALSFLGLFSFILDMGFSTANIKRLNEGIDFEEGITAYFIIKVILAIIFVSTVLLTIFIWVDVLHRGFQTIYEEYAIFILMFYYVIQSFIVYYQSVFTASVKAAIVSMPILVESVFRNSLYIILSISLVKFLVNRDEFALVMAFISVIAYAIYLSIYLPYAKNWRFKKPSKELFMKYIVFAIPVSISGVMGSISTNINNIFIQFFWGLNSVGAYSSILKIVSYITVFSTALVSMLYPTLSSLNHTGNSDEYKGKMLASEKYISLSIMPIVIFMIVFPWQVLNLWSKDLIPYSSILVVFSIMVYVNSINSPYSIHFNAVGNPKFIMYTSFISLATILILNTFLIPQNFLSLGALGAAIANLVASLIVAFVVRIKTYRTIGIFGNKHLIGQFFGAFLTFLILHFLSYHFPTTPFWSLIIWLILSYILYLSILYLFRILKKEDIEFILEVINPKKMLSYIKSEMGNR